MALPDLQDLLDLLPDNTSGDIEAVDMRDITTALYNGILDNENNFDNFLPVSGLVPLASGYQPTLPLSIATKEYVDFAAGQGGNFVNKSGDTMTGALFLPFADPTEYTEAVHLGFVSSLVATLDNEVATNFLRLIGGTLTGPLILNNDPAQALEAATKQYVDTIAQAAIPAGSIQAYAGEGVPAGWLRAEGDVVSRTEYPDLFAAIGTIYGAGDGSTTFKLPNYKGRFLRGRANGSGNDPDRASRTDRGDGTTGDAVGTKQTSAQQKITGSVTGILNQTSNGLAAGGSFAPTGTGQHQTGTQPSNSNGSFNIDSSRQVRTSLEARPTNINVNYLIKT